MKTVRILALASLIGGVAQAEITDRIEQKLARVNTELSGSVTSSSAEVRQRRLNKKQAGAKKTCTTQTKRAKK